MRAFSAGLCSVLVSEACAKPNSELVHSASEDVGSLHGPVLLRAQVRDQTISPIPKTTADNNRTPIKSSDVHPGRPALGQRFS